MRNANVRNDLNRLWTPTHWAAEFLFILQKYSSSVPFYVYKCTQCFVPTENFVKPYQTSKALSLCLGAGQIFVKRQNCQILQFADVDLAKSVNQITLISLFRVYKFRQKPVRLQRDWHLWLSNILVFSSAYAITKFKIWWRQNLSKFWQSLTSLVNLVRTVPMAVMLADEQQR